MVCRTAAKVLVRGSLGVDAGAVVGKFGPVEMADVGGGVRRAGGSDVGAEKWSRHVVSARAYDRRSVWWRWPAITATPSKLGCSPSAASTRHGGSHSKP